jgi:hypothetical protein
MAGVWRQGGNREWKTAKAPLGFWLCQKSHSLRKQVLETTNPGSQTAIMVLQIVPRVLEIAFLVLKMTFTV